jgi:hypothetical protein
MWFRADIIGLFSNNVVSFSRNVVLSESSLVVSEVEAVFRALKSDLAIRPIWHFAPKRVEAHIMVAFLGYRL